MEKGFSGKDLLTLFWSCLEKIFSLLILKKILCLRLLELGPYRCWYCYFVNKKYCLKAYDYQNCILYWGHQSEVWNCHKNPGLISEWNVYHNIFAFSQFFGEPIACDAGEVGFIW